MSKKEYGVNTITPADSVQVPVMDGDTPGNLTMASLYGYVNNKMKPTIGYRLNLELDTTTYVITPKLYDINGNLISTGDSVDLPMESVVVNGSYDSTNKKIVLTLKNGNTIDIPVSDLISGLVTTTTFNTALALKADASDLSSHVNNSTIHLTSDEKEVVSVFSWVEDGDGNETLCIEV